MKEKMQSEKILKKLMRKLNETYGNHYGPISESYMNEARILMQRKDISYSEFKNKLELGRKHNE